MPTPLVLALTCAGAVALWLGLSLGLRDPRDPRLASAGLGLVAYAFAVAGLALLVGAGDEAPRGLARFWASARYLPAIFWVATLVSLAEGVASSASDGPIVGRGRTRALGAGIAGMLLAAMLIPEAVILGLVIQLGLAAALLLVLRHRGRWRGSAGVFGLVGLASLFFALGASPLLLSETGDSVLGIPMPWLAAGLAGDFLLLGLAVAALDAFEQGEAFGADLLRSFGASTGLGLLLGGQVLAAMMLGAGVGPVMLGLWVASVFSAVVIVAVAPRAQREIDRLVLARRPELLREREQLQAVASALPRSAVRGAGGGTRRIDPVAWDEDQLYRHSRNALSHYGDLSRLASSPLTRLPEIDRRLAARGARFGTLDRANELKRLLAESVDRLKPPGPEPFGTSDEWRYFNVLYFPYVLGCKPFSRDRVPDDLGSDARRVLTWLREQVPERTFYNWQRAAAQLVAQDLRDLHRSSLEPADSTSIATTDSTDSTTATAPSP